MKVAKFKYLGQHSYETVSGEELDGVDSYVRTSEYVEVDFPPLNSDEVVQKQLDVLERAEDELRSKFQAALNHIETQRAELRAITYRP